MYNRDNNTEVQDLTINDCYHIIDDRYVNISALFNDGVKQVMVRIKLSEFKQMVRTLQNMDIDDNCRPPRYC